MAQRLFPGIAYAWAAFVSLGLAAPVSAQPAPQAQQAEVVAVVRKLFDAMQTRDTVAIRSVFDPEARLVTMGRQAQGGLQVTTVDQFLRSIAASRAQLVERIYNPEVRIDGPLATVWAFYTLHIGEEFSHCGVDAFQLLRIAETWKIVHVADTRRMEPCQPPGGG